MQPCGIQAGNLELFWHSVDAFLALHEWDVHLMIRTITSVI